MGKTFNHNKTQQSMNHMHNFWDVVYVMESTHYGMNPLDIMSMLLWIHSFHSCNYKMDIQGWFLVCTQPMREVVTKQLHLSLAGRRPRISPGHDADSTLFSKYAKHMDEQWYNYFLLINKHTRPSTPSAVIYTVSIWHLKTCRAI